MVTTEAPNRNDNHSDGVRGGDRGITRRKVWSRKQQDDSGFGVEGTGAEPGRFGGLRPRATAGAVRNGRIENGPTHKLGFSDLSTNKGCMPAGGGGPSAWLIDQSKSS